MLKGQVMLLIGVLAGGGIVYAVMRAQYAQTDARPLVAASVDLPPDHASAVGVDATTRAAGGMSGDRAGKSHGKSDANGNGSADVAATDSKTTPPSATAAGVPPPPSQRPADAGPTGLIVPVAGVRIDQLVDTYTQARSEGRVHDAIDILAPAGTPVLAAADGRIEKLFTSDRGGLTMYQFAPGGRYGYYYAHLQRYADGIGEGGQLRQGEVIGYVGSTGNADPAAPHLHFAVYMLGPEQQWWHTTPINPYPLLQGR